MGIDWGISSLASSCAQTNDPGAPATSPAWLNLPPLWSADSFAVLQLHLGGKINSLPVGQQVEACLFDAYAGHYKDNLDRNATTANRPLLYQTHWIGRNDHADNHGRFKCFADSSVQWHNKGYAEVEENLSPFTGDGS